MFIDQIKYDIDLFSIPSGIEMHIETELTHCELILFFISLVFR